MTVIKSKDIELGIKIEVDNEPYLVIENNFVNMGRGQAFYKVKIKNIINNSIISKTIKVGEKLKTANIITKDLQFLYTADNLYYFFDSVTLEYHEINHTLLNNKIKLLKEGNLCSVTFWNNEAIEVKLPKFVELKVISNDSVKKDSGTHKNFKYVTIETDDTIKVPLFIKLNDIIKIDTNSGSYISRVNN
ncbi:MAG: elongation factor P [Candidatus Riesia sp.]|nr:elongation factor P [Candidatus Riesia sp.]